MITHVGSASVVGPGSAVSATVTAPNGISVGDCILLGITVAGTRTFTWPAGFVEVEYANMSGTTVAAAYKVADGTESGTGLGVTISGIAGPKITLLCTVYSGTDVVSPINVATSGTAASSATYTTPTTYTTADECVEISFIGKTRGVTVPQITVFSQPAPLTKAIEAFTTEGSGSSAMAVGYYLTALNNGSPVGGRTWTADQAAQSGGITIALKPATIEGGESATESVTHRGASSAVVGGSTTTCSVAIPSTLQPDDLILLGITVASTRTFTWPAGFAEVEYANVAGTTVAVAYKFAGGGEAGTDLPVTISGVAGPKITLVCGVYYGTHPTDPISVSNAVASTTQSSSVITPGIITTAPQCAEVSFVGMTRGNSSPQITAFTAASPLTKVVENFTTVASGSSAMALGHNLSGVNTGTSIGNRLWTADQAAQSGAVTLAIAPASAVDAVYVSVGSDQVVEPFSTVTLHANTLGGSSPVVSWSQTSGTSVTLGGSGTTRTFTAPALIDGGTLTFNAQASDGQTSDNATSTVAVYPVNEFIRTAGSGWDPIEIDP